VGIIDPVADLHKITTNYNEMVNRPDKKVVAIGLPEHIDLDKNIVFGDRYEDVEYVKPSKSKKKGKKSKGHRFSKKQVDSSSDSEESSSASENELDDLLEVEFADEVETAEDAYDSVMRH